MAAARKRAFNGRSMSDQSRNGAIASIQINWKKMNPDLEGDDLRGERLAWISYFLGLPTIDSIKDLSDEQLGAVAGEMKRLTGMRSADRGVRNESWTAEPSGNVVRFPLPEPANADEPSAVQQPEVSFAASPEMVYTLEKLEAYIGWSMEQRDAYLKKRFKCSSFRMLRYAEAHKCLHAMLKIAAHRDLKRRDPSKPVSRAAIAKYVPLLKEQLNIDQKRN